MKKENEEAHWIRCPVCGGKNRLKVYYNTALFNYPLFCPKCKTEKITLDNAEKRIYTFTLAFIMGSCAQRSIFQLEFIRQNDEF